MNRSLVAGCLQWPEHSVSRFHEDGVRSSISEAPDNECLPEVVKVICQRPEGKQRAGLSWKRISCVFNSETLFPLCRLTAYVQ
ncbi:hypothetical protein CEXT_534171 [Caerostris extrusa]|uniref:Uncharacterized protein n=1 Tax=Caerostris extrusa TaxID=172846 RepID=A0AAV4QR75_CAEEX|nr:hypothetical protein CEXT_534171 [Caerostris extrusa]